MIMGYSEMDQVWDKSQASKTDKLVLLAIARRYTRGKGAWPSQRYLAKACGVNARSIRSSINRLEALGELTWITGNDKSGKSNLYLITFIESKTSAIDAKTSAVSAKTSAISDKNFRLLNKELNTLDKLNNAFDQFWGVYPRKSGRSAAFEAFLKAIPNVSIDDLLTATRAYRDSVSGVELRFVKLPVTWLVNECWLDQVDFVDADDWMGRAVDD